MCHVGLWRSARVAARSRRCSHRSLALPHVFVEQLGALDGDEVGPRLAGHRLGHQRLAAPCVWRVGCARGGGGQSGVHARGVGLMGKQAKPWGRISLCMPCMGLAATPSGHAARRRLTPGTLALHSPRHVQPSLPALVSQPAEPGAPAIVRRLTWRPKKQHARARLQPHCLKHSWVGDGLGDGERQLLPHLRPGQQAAATQPACPAQPAGMLLTSRQRLEILSTQPCTIPPLQAQYQCLSAVHHAILHPSARPHLPPTHPPL